ncbi:Oidioi.mRNA.OKI2018_I69.XSR.g13914.t1.cds [Oikopleura dioica]|uniref:Oidioi.mRNA.OKI2018_I69.XSR.g13914.t1.cds n=1 Tax=Oikopleura dioica TaxID=34765 RepID=A0ABN7SC44_OIKDI|nr:Oidioi.mRNA.OKI2018_I69.XSR.g13914.t1.cds [Oikopleura dioica]
MSESDSQNTFQERYEAWANQIPCIRTSVRGDWRDYVWEWNESLPCESCEVLTDIMWKFGEKSWCSACYLNSDPHIRRTGKPYRVDAILFCQWCQNKLSFWEACEGICCNIGLERQQSLQTTFFIFEEPSLRDRHIPLELKQLDEIKKEQKFLQYDNELAKLNYGFSQELLAKLKYESTQERLALHDEKEKMARERLGRILIKAGKSLIANEDTKKG